MSRPATEKGTREFSSPTAIDPLLNIQRKLRWLTIAVFMTALALFFNAATVLGYIIDYHFGEGILIGGTCAGGIVIGFLFGWLARRAAGPNI